jgi:diketogulonate reductase-like aldo/keto reductase
MDIPPILYGTAWKKDATAALVAQALRAGFRGIDTACQPKHYREPGVGEGVATALTDGLTRADLYLQTKFTPTSGQDPKTVPYDAWARPDEQVLQSCAVSLRNLCTDYLDALVLHSPISDAPRMQQVWGALETLVKRGVVRRLGISNCYDLGVLERLCRDARIAPVIVQNRFYAETGYDREIRAFCRERGICYQSFWTLSANPHLLANAALIGIARSHAVTPAQALFRYLTQRGVTPLTGTKSAQHLRESLAIFAFELEERELATIDGLLG